MNYTVLIDSKKYEVVVKAGLIWVKQENGELKNLLGYSEFFQGLVRTSLKNQGVEV